MLSTLDPFSLTPMLALIDVVPLLHVFKVVFGIGFIIFVHELGHFLAAKKVGIRVETFSLGFGPRVIGFRSGGTDYRVSILPLGGYVKMAGESPIEAKTGSEDEFVSKTVGQRAFVLSAGVIMNVLSTFLIFPLAFRIGVPYTSPEIGYVEPGSPAWHVGLEPGDRIVRIDGDPVFKFEAIIPLVALSDAEQGIVVDYERDGETKSVRVFPSKSDEVGLYTIGIRADYDFQVEEGSPAFAAGLRTGDSPVSVDGESGLRGILEKLSTPDQTVSIEVDRDGERQQFDLETKVKESEGFRLGVSALMNVVAGVRKESFGAGLGLRDGDVVVGANGREVLDPNDLRQVLAETKPEEDFSVSVLRAKKEEILSAPRTHASAEEILNDLDWQPNPSSRVRPLEDSPLSALGVPRGATIVALGNAEAVGRGAAAVDSFSGIRDAIGAYPGEGKALTLQYREGEDGEVRTAEVVPLARFESDLGLIPRTKTYIHRESNILNACRAGFQNTWVEFTRVLLVLQRMVTGSVSPKNLGGPLTIAVSTYQSAEGGLAKLLMMLGLLSVNLAVFNLLPIPILDGGQLLFLGIEKIKGSPVSEGVLGLFQWAGLIFILALLLFVTFQDIQRIL